MNKREEKRKKQLGKDKKHNREGKHKSFDRG